MKRTKKHKVPSVDDLKTSILGNLDKTEVGKFLKLGQEYEQLYHHEHSIVEGWITQSKHQSRMLAVMRKDIELLKTQNSDLERKLGEKSTACEKLQTQHYELSNKFQSACKNVKKFALERNEAKSKLDEVTVVKNKLTQELLHLGKRCKAQRELGRKTSKAEIAALKNALEAEIVDTKALEQQLETVTKERDVLRQKWGGMQNAFSSLRLPALEDAVVSAAELAVSNQELVEEEQEEDEDSDDESGEEEEEVEQEAVDVD